MSPQNILILAETKQDSVADPTFELLAAARRLAAGTGGQVIAVVLSADGARYAGSLSAADRILLINDPLLANYSPKPYLAVLANLVGAESPRAVLVASTSIGWDVAPALAARLKAPLVIGTKAVQASGAVLEVTSGFCGGKMLADLEVAGSPAILMMLPGSYRPGGETGQAKMETRSSPVPLQPGAIHFDEMILPQAGDVDITQQDILVAIGRGIQQKDNLDAARELAEALGAELAASRPIVDQGWLPATRQVGKSGMAVKPRCYIALGISGAPEHVEGMKDSGLIIAVNTDPNAPIFEVAHYGAVVDLMDLAPALTEAIKQR